MHVEDFRRHHTVPNRLYFDKTRFKGSINDLKSMSGADINSDHNLFLADIETRLRRIRKLQRIKQLWNLGKERSSERRFIR